MKILIIQKNDMETIGGVERYNSNLNDLFLSEGHVVDILSFAQMDNKKFKLKKSMCSRIEYCNKKFDETNSFVIKFIFLYFLCFNTRKAIKRIDFDTYDLIIDSTYIFFKKIAANSKCVWVQHSAPKFYYGYVSKSKAINFIFTIFSKLILQRGDFFKSKNVVVFDFFNEQFCKNNLNIFTIPIGLYSKSEIINIQTAWKIDKKTNISYLGRLDNSSKNLDLLVSKKITVPIHVYGSGPNESILIKKSNISFMGKYKKKDLFSIFSTTKYTLLPSNYEGFPLTVVESLSHGVPVLIKNSFPSARFLCVNNYFLAENDDSFVDKLNTLQLFSTLEYKNMVNECFKFSLQNLTLEAFFDNWKKLLTMITHK